MENRLNKVLQVLKEPESLIVIIGIIVAAVLAYSGIRNNDIQQALAAILSILGALAVAQLVTGYDVLKRDRQIEATLSALQKQVVLGNVPLRVRTELQPIPIRAKNAKNILIIGRSLATVLRYTEFFQERLRDGTTIRVAIIDPNNKAVCTALSPLLEMSLEGSAGDLQSSLGLLKRVTQGEQTRGKLEIRVIEFVPTLSLAAVDTQLSTGHIVVELLPYQVSPPSRPHLIFRANDNPSWFVYFRDVAERIWRDAKPYEAD